MLWSCSFVGCPQPQTKLPPMAVAMIALPFLGASAPLAHTAISCLCVCCARFASTGLMFRPTGGWWIGFHNALVHWWTMDWLFQHTSLMDLWWMMLLFLLWYCVCSRNCDILLVFPANWFSVEKRSPLDFCRLCSSYVLRTSCVMIVLCCGSDLNFNCESFCSSVQAFHWLLFNCSII